MEPPDSSKAFNSKKLIAIILLSLVALAVLYAIITMIPHPYAGWGLVAFILLAAPAYFFLPRWRILVILGLALLIGVTVGLLHVHATQRITIRNENRLDIATIHLYSISGNSGIDFTIPGVPAGGSASCSFLLSGFDGNALCADGKLSDGTSFSLQGLNSLDYLFNRNRPAALYRGGTLLIIRPGGSITREFP